MKRKFVPFRELSKTLSRRVSQTGSDDAVFGVGSAFVKVCKEAAYSIGANEVVDPFRTEAVAFAMLVRLTFRAVTA